MKIKTRKEWSTHMPLLIKAVMLTNGPIMELGAGIFSTPLLHWLCAESYRPLVTYEKDPDYYMFAKRFQSRSHKIYKINNWMDIDTKTHWSVALIDQDSDRGKTAILLKNSVDFILLHDSQDEILYGYDKAYPHFKYIYHWKFGMPYTTVVSNFNNLKKIQKNVFNKIYRSNS